MPEKRPDSSESPREPTSFAKWIDALVPAVFPTDAALARAVGVTRGTVTRWRQGMTPQLPALYALANAAGVSPEVVFRIAGYGTHPSGSRSEKESDR